jgi:alpha-glucosidase
MKYWTLIIFLVAINCSCNIIQPVFWEASSPDTDMLIKVGLNDEGQLLYQTFFKGELLIDTSYLGIDLHNAPDLRKGFSVISVDRSSFNETWEQPWGEEQWIKNHYNEIVIQVQEKSGFKRRMNVVFRVFDDGIGFRYEFPEQEHLRNIEIINEYTEFNFVENHKSWWIPAMEPNRYEYLYQTSSLSDIENVHTPLTLQTESGICVSLHEADLQNYSSMYLRGDSSNCLKSELIPYSESELGRAFVSTPGKSPWRTITIAENPADLLTSYIILNLNEPNQIGDVSWFKPGKYIGVWWEMHIGKGTWTPGNHHSANTQNTKKYIDFAARHGFDGVLVEGWNKGWDSDWVGKGEAFSFTEPYPDYDVEELHKYANSRGVYLVGHHETGGNVDNYEQQITEAYQFLSKYDMKAVKTGYVEHGNLLTNGKYHHGQSYIDHFRKVIRLAAEHQVAIIAHEPIKDTGERRTYPNIVAREGARGQEFNAWSNDGGNPPDHTLILPFTRCLASPFDFTPGVFDLKIPKKPNNQVNTTLAKQLALYVVIYSPMQMACDLPKNYEAYPDAFEFIKRVGVDWERTIVLHAEIGDLLTIARKERDTEDWFVGSITDETGREISIDLDFLAPGEKYRATIYRDGPDAHYLEKSEDYKIDKILVDSNDTIDAKLAPGGGIAISLHKIEKGL